jgi:hypothetical protein
MDTATELEQWLRKEAQEKTKYAESRKSAALAFTSETSDADRKAAHQMAQQIMGRKFPMQSRTEEEKSNRIQIRIAAKLEQEAAMLLRFADFVAGRNNGNHPVVERQES